MPRRCRLWRNDSHYETNSQLISLDKRIPADIGVIMNLSIPKVLLAGAVAFSLSLPAKAAEITYRIPLYIFNTGTSSAKQEFKVGIRLKVASISKGLKTPWRMYEFDTGGTGFLAFPYSTTQTENIAGAYKVEYGSGNMLTGNRSDTRIFFESNSAALQPSVRSNIVLITGASGTSSHGTSLDNWQKDLPDTPPLETYFYGDFGMSLATLQPKATGTDKALHAIIPQLPAAGSGGFIIHLGDRPANDAPKGKYGEVARGWIQVGLTAKQRKTATWDATVSMQGKTDKRYPHSRLPIYSLILSSGTLHLTGMQSQPTSIVYDTGAPNVEIHPVGSAADLEAEIADILASSNPVTLKLDGEPKSPPQSSTILDFQLGDSAAKDKAKESTQNVVNSPGLFVNTGITAFFGSDVVFNLDDGFVGFRSSSTSSSSSDE